METLSAEYRQFLEIRGRNPSTFAREKAPITKKGLEKARERFAKLLELMQNPEFQTIRTALRTLSSEWMRAGKLTQEDHMELVRTYETLTEGETTEEFLSKL